MSIEKTEDVFRSFVRQDGKAKISPLIYYEGSHLYQRSGQGKKAVRTYNQNAIHFKGIVECIAVRLSEFTIVHPELVKSQVLPLLRDYNATELFDDDFETVKKLLERDSLERHFPHMLRTTYGREQVLYRNDKHQLITAKKALALKKRHERVKSETIVVPQPVGMAERLSQVLGQYDLKSPYGDDEYDLMRYFNRVYLKSQYNMALCDLDGFKQQTVSLVSKPLRVNHRWTFIEDKQDAMLLMVAVPFKEKVYLTDW